MSGFVIFLILIGIIIIIKFASDSSGDTDKIVKEGGMRVKYKTLIDNFVDPESGLKIIKETNKYVCVGMNNAAGSLAFHFQHTFSVINVTYELKNVFLGNHKLNWSFPESMDQNEMIKQIESRTKQYMDNVSAKFN